MASVSPFVVANEVSLAGLTASTTGVTAGAIGSADWRPVYGRNQRDSHREKENGPRSGPSFFEMVEVARIELASGSPLQSGLHA